MPRPFDGDAMAQVNVNGDQYIVNRYNSAVFGHLGGLMMYDHIFIAEQIVEDTASMPGAYIFRQNSGFPALRNWMRKNRFVSHLNLTEVAECDKRAFEMTIEMELQDLGDTPPEW